MKASSVNDAATLDPVEILDFWERELTTQTLIYKFAPDGDAQPLLSFGQAGKAPNKNKVVEKKVKFDLLPPSRTSSTKRSRKN